ncbi:predicted protein [Nematostella vectensis]|uniref:Uncharacterized protein n=1 Tax=Nematostella vectensis TaxID=45351 RepID=A7STM4_NEMVE|nr:predicted protein [Nematostella vectensis]|eukprot:XP_001625027.1 predicted protein [Nematostella vectensis]
MKTQRARKRQKDPEYELDETQRARKRQRDSEYELDETQRARKRERDSEYELDETQRARKRQRDSEYELNETQRARKRQRDSEYELDETQRARKRERDSEYELNETQRARKRERDSEYELNETQRARKRQRDSEYELNETQRARCTDDRQASTQSGMLLSHQDSLDQACSSTSTHFVPVCIGDTAVLRPVPAGPSQENAVGPEEGATVQAVETTHESAVVPALETAGESASEPAAELVVEFVPEQGVEPTQTPTNAPEQVEEPLDLVNRARAVGVDYEYVTQGIYETADERQNRHRRIARKVPREERRLREVIGDLPPPPPAGSTEQEERAYCAIRKFELEQLSYTLTYCQVCKERRPQGKTSRPLDVCQRCKRDKNVPKMWSAENHMDPAEQPAYSAYSDVTIDVERIENLPLDGDLPDIRTVEFAGDVQREDDQGPAPQQINPGETDDADDSTVSGILLPEPGVNVRDQIQSAVERLISEEGNDNHAGGEVNNEGEEAHRQDNNALRNGAQRPVIPWPSTDETPASEFSTPYFFTMAFPCLFPYGLGDFHINRPRTAPHLHEWAEHLEWYQDGRFIKHKVWKFVVHNMIMRKRALEQSGYYVDQQLGDPHMTVADLQERMARGDTTIANKLLYFGASLRGTSQYWDQRRRELRAMVQCLVNEKRGLHDWYEFAKSRGQIHWHQLSWREDRQPHELLHQAVQEECPKPEKVRRLNEWVKDNFDTQPTWMLRRRLCLKTILLNRVGLHACSDYCLHTPRHDEPGIQPGERVCRMEFGSEYHRGKPKREEPDIVADHNGADRLEMARDHPRVVQHSRYNLQSWRANCDLSVILSNSPPDNPSTDDIIAIVDYLCAYACQQEQLKTSLRTCLDEPLFVALSRAKSAGGDNADPDFAFHEGVLVNEDRFRAVDSRTTRARTFEMERLHRLSEQCQQRHEFAPAYRRDTFMELLQWADEYNHDE